MVKKLVGLAKNNHPEKRCIADTEIYNVRNFKKIITIIIMVIC